MHISSSYHLILVRDADLDSLASGEQAGFVDEEFPVCIFLWAACYSEGCVYYA